MKILLVEDNEMNRDMLSRRLARRGYDVAVAVDGAEGVATARRDLPGLILLDMSLPVMDGWTAARELKADPDTGAIPIIALTAHAMEGDRDRALEAGCDDFDTKPIDLGRLVDKIEALLAPSPSPDSPMELVSAARMEQLPVVAAFVEQACRDAQLHEDVAMALRLAVEEVFTNIVHHGYPAGPGPVVLSVASDADGLTVTVRDEGIPFDPADALAPDLESGWEERRIGGLGWHLVRQLVDEVHHQPGPGGGNIVTLVKRLPQGGPDPGAAHGTGDTGRAA